MTRSPAPAQVTRRTPRSTSSRRTSRPDPAPVDGRARRLRRSGVHHARRHRAARRAPREAAARRPRRRDRPRRRRPARRADPARARLPRGRRGPRRRRGATGQTLGADLAAAPGDAPAAIAAWTRELGADLVLVAPPRRAASRPSSPPTSRATRAASSRSAPPASTCRGACCITRNCRSSVSRSYGPGRYDPAYEEHGRDYPLPYVRWTERENMRAFLDLIADGRVDVRAADLAPLPDRRRPPRPTTCWSARRCSASCSSTRTSRRTMCPRRAPAARIGRRHAWRERRPAAVSFIGTGQLRRGRSCCRPSRTVRGHAPRRGRGDGAVGAIGADTFALRLLRDRRRRGARRRRHATPSSSPPATTPTPGWWSRALDGGQGRVRREAALPDRRGAGRDHRGLRRCRRRRRTRRRW